MFQMSSAPIIIKLCVPNKEIKRIRLLTSQKISIINMIKIFGPNNKMLFISKGIILPYNKSVEECNIRNGDYIFGLKFDGKDSLLDEKMSFNNFISIPDIVNDIPLIGPNFEVNLTSINTLLSISQNQESLKSKIYLLNKSTSKEIARLQDLKAFKRDVSSKYWRKKSYHLKNEIKINSNSQELTNINYNALKEPCCEAFPIIFNSDC